MACMPASEVDRESPVAVYLQIASDMRRRIEAAEWQPRKRIPGIPDLMSEYGVARLTMRKAMIVLAGDGIVEKSPGKGYYVASE